MGLWDWPVRSAERPEDENLLRRPLPEVLAEITAGSPVLPAKELHEQIGETPSVASGN
jgi:hypothetical protein